MTTPDSPTKRSWIVRHAVLLLPVLLVAGCGSGTSGAAKPSTRLAATQAATVAPLSRQEQAKMYLAAVAPAHVALDKFRAEVSDKTPMAEMVRAAQSMATAMDTLDNELARIAFTGAAATDVRSLIAAHGVLKGDLRAVGTQGGFSAAAFSAAFSRDSVAQSAASRLMRADLGLPPQ